MRHSLTALSLLFGLSTVVACGQGGGGSEELEEIRNQQRQILAKLDDMSEKLEEVAKAPAPAAKPQRPRGPDPEKKYDIPVAHSPVRGDESAPVSIVEFSDYQCPFCARAEPLMNQALEAYPDKVNVVFKHFPLTSIHPQAMPAARAAMAAKKQGKFWEMHDKIFENSRSLSEDKLVEIAGEIGLDVEQFKADMKSDEIEQMVQEDMRLASKLNVRGTPTIFVGGKLLRNRSLEGIKQMVDEAAG